MLKRHNIEKDQLANETGELKSTPSSKTVFDLFQMCKLDLSDMCKFDPFDMCKLDLFDICKLDLFDPNLIFLTHANLTFLTCENLTFLTRAMRLGARPGIGSLALSNFSKYFCTRLAICNKYYQIIYRK